MPSGPPTVPRERRPCRAGRRLVGLPHWPVGRAGRPSPLRPRRAVRRSGHRRTREVRLVDLAGRALVLEILDRLPEKLPLVQPARRGSSRRSGCQTPAALEAHAPEAHRGHLEAPSPPQIDGEQDAGRRRRPRPARPTTARRRPTRKGRAAPARRNGPRRAARSSHRSGPHGPRRPPRRAARPRWARPTARWRGRRSSGT